MSSTFRICNVDFVACIKHAHEKERLERLHSLKRDYDACMEDGHTDDKRQQLGAVYKKQRLAIVNDKLEMEDCF